MSDADLPTCSSISTRRTSCLLDTVACAPQITVYFCVLHGREVFVKCWFPPLLRGQVNHYLIGKSWKYPGSLRSGGTFSASSCHLCRILFAVTGRAMLFRKSSEDFASKMLKPESHWKCSELVLEEYQCGREHRITHEQKSMIPLSRDSFCASAAVSCSYIRSMSVAEAFTSCLEGRSVVLWGLSKAVPVEETLRHFDSLTSWPSCSAADGFREQGHGELPMTRAGRRRTMLIMLRRWRGLAGLRPWDWWLCNWSLLRWVSSLLGGTIAAHVQCREHWQHARIERLTRLVCIDGLSAIELLYKRLMGRDWWGGRHSNAWVSWQGQDFCGSLMLLLFCGTSISWDMLSSTRSWLF